MADEHYTLLGVRADGVAPVIDLVVAGSGAQAFARARTFLNEHQSLSHVEVWLGGSLLREILRNDENASSA